MKKTKSKQPRKQRKWLSKAPLHARNRMLSSSLSDELRKKYGRKSVPVRKGDTVKIMRGSLRGHQGEVMKVDYSRYKIYVEGVTSKKADGTDVERPIHPSNVRITDIYEEDKERREMLTRKVEGQ